LAKLSSQKKVLLFSGQLLLSTTWKEYNRTKANVKPPVVLKQHLPMRDK